MPEQEDVPLIWAEDTREAAKHDVTKERYGAFLLYVDDWLSSTAIELMTAAEERGYLRLLMHAWKSGDCGLPDDDKILAKLSKLNRSWRGKSRAVIRAQFYERDGRLFNARLVKERQYQQGVKSARSKAGRAAAEARWDASRIRDAQQKNANSKSNPNSSIKTDIDYPPTHQKKLDASVDLSSSVLRQYARLRNALYRYRQQEGQEDIQPTNRLVVDVMSAAHGARPGTTEQEVIDCLKYLYEGRGLRPGTRSGPRYWSWFPITVADHFAKMRQREEAANPCGYHEGMDRNDYRLEKEQFDKMTDAIEIEGGEA
jgi:uncharacterized protein YdaU (DUF1376 family)